MSNQKISQLPAATALTGTESVPIVQAGQTRRAVVSAIADLRKGTWQAPTLIAPWTNYGESYAAAGYRKDGSRMQLRGMIKGGAGGSVLFFLPAAYRPSARLLFVGLTHPNAMARIDVTATGDVALASPSSGTITWVCLDGIAFVLD